MKRALEWPTLLSNQIKVATVYFETELYRHIAYILSILWNSCVMFIHILALKLLTWQLTRASVMSEDVGGCLSILRAQFVDSHLHVFNLCIVHLSKLRIVR